MALLMAFVVMRVGAEPAPAKHVLLIGLDGARADVIRDHAGPALKSLIARGTVCWQAQAVKPSVTQVNWASVLTGCVPERHGIKMHPVKEEELAPMHVKVPTLFDLVAADGLTSAGYLGHWKLYPNESTMPTAHVERSPYEAARVAPIAARHIEDRKPNFCFVYFGNLDGAGHSAGWMSERYVKAVEEVDAGVATLLAAVDRAKLTESTIVVVTSDHGGHGKAHAEGTREDTTIPWIIAGPGVRKGAEIAREVSTTDTAPTILRALGLRVPEHCDGKVVGEAFVGEK